MIVRMHAPVADYNFANFIFGLLMLSGKLQHLIRYTPYLANNQRISHLIAWKMLYSIRNMHRAPTSTFSVPSLTIVYVCVVFVLF